MASEHFKHEDDAQVSRAPIKKKEASTKKQIARAPTNQSSQLDAKTLNISEMKLLVDKSKLLSKMRLPVLFHPDRTDKVQQKFHIVRLDANDDLDEWDAWSAFVTTGVAASQHLLEDTLRECELKGVESALLDMNPNFVSARSVVDFFCNTCQGKCFANEQALVLAGKYQEFKFAVTFQA